MRIIAGEHRGRRLLAPESDTTRPITDRAKQSLFDVISPRIDEAVVYDCFAGTGSMGLECLSRGAAQATFFERDRSALLRLKQNIDTLGVAGRARGGATDPFRAFDSMPVPPKPAALIFFPPPYLARHLAPDGLILFRHDSADTLALPSLSVVRTLTYGSMSIQLLQPPAGP